VVGQVGNQENSAAALPAGAGQTVRDDVVYGVLAFEDISIDKLDGLDFGELPGGDLGEAAVELDSDYPAGDFGQKLRHGTCAAADFEHDVVLPDIRGFDEQLHQILVDEEMLAEPFVGPDTRR